MGLYINHLNPQIASLITGATNLEQLHDACIEALSIVDEDVRANLDLSNLPTYGGAEPRETYGVWSWDETRLLVGDGSVDDWRIMTRAEWENRE